MKEHFKISWRDLLCVLIASALTKRVLNWLGWSDGFGNYILVFSCIFILSAIIIIIIEKAIKAVKK